VDLERRFIDGRRILGDGVTIRGSLVGILLGTLSGLAMTQFEHPYLTNNDFIKIILIAFFLSLGAILGDAAGSFIKRRLGMERGAPAPLLDQLNFVVGGLLLTSFLVKVPFMAIIILFVLTPFGHILVNKTGYLLKMKDVPW
jgi:CDP-2,3-bis-(O-geranylgeranyl)-sn-glycerol synthase